MSNPEQRRELRSNKDLTKQPVAPLPIRPQEYKARSRSNLWSDTETKRPATPISKVATPVNSPFLRRRRYSASFSRDTIIDSFNSLISNIKQTYNIDRVVTPYTNFSLENDIQQRFNQEHPDVGADRQLLYLEFREDEVNKALKEERRAIKQDNPHNSSLGHRLTLPPPRVQRERHEESVKGQYPA